VTDSEFCQQAADVKQVTIKPELDYIYIFIHQNGSIKRKKYTHTKIYNKQERKQK